MIEESYTFINPLGNHVSIHVSDMLRVDEHGVMKEIPTDFNVSLDNMEVCGDYVMHGALKVKRTTAYAIQVFKSYIFASILDKDKLANISKDVFKEAMLTRIVKEGTVEYLPVRNLFLIKKGDIALKFTEAELDILRMMPSFISLEEELSEEEEWFVQTYCQIETPIGLLQKVNNKITIGNFDLTEELKVLGKEK